MNKREIPDIETFKKVAKRLRGHKSNMADYFGVDRHTLKKWMNENPEYEIVVNDSRMRCFDDVYDRMYLLATGIPDYKEVEDADGKKRVVFNGWIERADGQTGRYLLGTLGREEGFGEKIEIKQETTVGYNPGVPTPKEDLKEMERRLYGRPLTEEEEDMMFLEVVPSHKKKAL